MPRWCRRGRVIFYRQDHAHYHEAEIEGLLSGARHLSSPRQLTPRHGAVVIEGGDGPALRAAGGR